MDEIEHGTEQEFPPDHETRPDVILSEALTRLEAEKSVELIYVDYDSRLTPQQVHLALQGQVQEVEEELDEYSADNSWYGTKWLIENTLVPDEDERDVLEADDARWQELVDAIRERDESDVFTGLLKHTPNMLLRYHLGPDPSSWDLTEQPWTWTDEQLHGWARHFLRKLGLDPQTRDPEDKVTNLSIMKTILEQCSYGGRLCVIFYADPEELVTAAIEDQYAKRKPTRIISFTDPQVHLVDTLNGAGFGDQLFGTVTRLWDHTRCVVDVAAPGYSWTETAGPYEPAYKTDVTLTTLPEKD